MIVNGPTGWFAAKPAQAGWPTTVESKPAVHPSATDLRRATKKLLRAEAVAQSDVQHRTAIGRLCDLYVVLRTHPRFADHSMLRQDAFKIRNRMLSVAQKTKSRLRREGIDRPDDLDQRVTAAINDALERAKHGDVASSGDVVLSKATSRSSQADKALAASTQDGSATGFAGGGEPAWELVELIERLIRPDFWDVNGGPGTIRYFALRRVLVISATTDIHQDIGDLLGSL